MSRPTKRRVERNAGAFLGPSHWGGPIPVPMRTLLDDYSDVPGPEDSDRVPEPEEEPGLARRLVRWLFIVLVGGLAMSVAAFWLTSNTMRYEDTPGNDYLCTERVTDPEFDPWTGQPRGLSYDRYGDDCLSGQPGAWENPTRVEEPVPDEMLGRQAIPMPVGFAVGVVITIGVMAGLSRRRRVSSRAGPH